MEEKPRVSIGSKNLTDKNSNLSKSSTSKKSFNITIFVILFLFAMLISIGVGVGSVVGILVNTYNTLPAPEEMANIKPSLVTRVYDKDSLLVHEFSIEKRFWMPLDSISPNMPHAVISIEDQRFYKHWGIDLKRIFGAALANVVSRGYSQGASTLTQQLARNLYFSHKKTLMRKVREILTAIKLEQYYTKNEIMELYLNQVYLGGGVYGVEAASQKYFSKPAKDLTVNEAAIIAGIIQRPERFRPDRKKNLKKIKNRRNSVLKGMVKMKFLTSAEGKEEREKPIIAKPSKKSALQAPYFVEKIRKYLERKYGEDLLYNGGLKVYTTLDSKAQMAAEKSLAEHLDTLQRSPNRIFLFDNKPWTKTEGLSRSDWYDNFDSLYEKYDTLFFDKNGKSKLSDDSLKLRKIQASVLAIDNKTGAVRVMIGGRNFEESRFNRALQTVRQPGSAIKPFVYAAAFEHGYTPATIIIDKPITLETPEGTWRPENYEHEFFGPITVRDALRHSVNIPAIRTLMDIGPNNVIALARSLGLKHQLPPVPALAIGACEVSNIEITRAYSAFANHGSQAKTYFIDRIENRKGRILEKHEIEVEQVMSRDVADLTAQVMRAVVDAGTGVRVRSLGFYRQAAGKTGHDRCSHRYLQPDEIRFDSCI